MVITSYLNTNHLPTSNLSFRPKHSTVTALSGFADDVLSNMEQGKLYGAVFLDLSKTFDTVTNGVPHETTREHPGALTFPCLLK